MPFLKTLFRALIFIVIFLICMVFFIALFHKPHQPASAWPVFFSFLVTALCYQWDKQRRKKKLLKATTPEHNRDETSNQDNVVQAASQDNSIDPKKAFAITKKRLDKLKLEDDYEIVGLFYEGRRKLLCKHKDEVKVVYLAPERDNPKDKYAVACYWINENPRFLEKRQNLVGYIPREQAKPLRNYFDILGITELEAKAKIWVPTGGDPNETLRLYVKPVWLTEEDF